MASLHVPQQVAPANRRLAQLCRAVRPTGCVAAASSQESTRVMRSPVEGTRIELIPQRPAGAKQAAGAANVRVTLVDEATGTHLSWATVIDQQLRFGGSSFLCGGIGGVATPEEHRRKGYTHTHTRTRTHTRTHTHTHTQAHKEQRTSGKSTIQVNGGSTATAEASSHRVLHWLHRQLVSRQRANERTVCVCVCASKPLRQG